MLYLLFILLLLPLLYILNKRYIPELKTKDNIIAVIVIPSLALIVCDTTMYDLKFFSLYIVYSLMFLLTFVDYKKMSIPDEMNIILFIFATIYTTIFLGTENLSFGMQLLGVFTAIWFITEAVFKREMFGLGDLLYIAILGYMLNDILSIVYIFLISSFIAIPISLLSIKLLKKREIPYLPFLTIAFVIEKMFMISKI